MKKKSVTTEIYQPFLPLVAFNLLQNGNVKQMIHYIQMAKVQRFQQYDYGTEGNEQHYGSKYPPEYPVSEIKVPFQIIYSDKDVFFGPDVRLEKKCLMRL